MSAFAEPKFMPQYRYKDGHFEELPQILANVLDMPPKGTFFAVWNSYSQKYEFAESNGPNHVTHRIWDIKQLPPEFQAYLLLLGVS